MLKVGVFGVGHLGKFHLNNWKSIDQVNIVGFFDPCDEIANAVEKEYGLKRYIDPSLLIEESDIIDVVVPTDKHFEICKDAIRKGKHVFVEKPMCDTVEKAQEIVNLVQEAKVKFQVGHVERFNPAFLALKETPLNPMFIEVHRLAQFNPRGTEVSVILDLMIHDIDIILSMVKTNVKRISASGVAVITDTPDIANVRIEFNNGCVANLTSSRISMKKMRKMRLFQKNAYIGIDFLERKTEIIHLQEGEARDPEHTFTFDLDTPHGKKTISVYNPPTPANNAILTELESFVDSVINDKPTRVSEIDGYLAIEVAYKILREINNNISKTLSK